MTQDQARVFVEAVRQYLEERPGEVGAAAFDKEDGLACDFVTAAANLRAAAYGIPQQSLFDTKVWGGHTAQRRTRMRCCYNGDTYCILKFNPGINVESRGAVTVIFLSRACSVPTLTHECSRPSNTRMSGRTYGVVVWGVRCID